MSDTPKAELIVTEHNKSYIIKIGSDEYLMSKQELADLCMNAMEELLMDDVISGKEELPEKASELFIRNLLREREKEIVVLNRKLRRRDKRILKSDAKIEVLEETISQERARTLELWIKLTREAVDYRAQINALTYKLSMRERDIAELRVQVVELIGAGESNGEDSDGNLKH